MNRIDRLLTELYRGDGGLFSQGLTTNKLIWIFFICCFLGYIVETLYCLPKNGFQSRQGVLYGPFIPVYGFGGVFLTMGLSKLNSPNIISIFIVSGILGAGFEYTYSLLQELLTGTVSWDYSDSPFNLFGRTSLLYGIYWGFLGIAWAKWAYPFMNRLIESIPSNIKGILTLGIVIFMTLNLMLSALAVKRQTERRHRLPPNDSLRRFLDVHYNDDYQARVFPYMKYMK